MKLWDKIYWVVKMFGPLDTLEVYEKVCENYQDSETITHSQVREKLKALMESGAILWNCRHDNTIRTGIVTVKYREPLF